MMSTPFAHPYRVVIMPPARHTDIHGSGAFGAPRGHRMHNGIDLACYPNSIICALKPGTVTKIGYPYDPNKPGNARKAHFRYVQVTDGQGHDLRYFYVDPAVQVGDVIETGQPLGHSQQLSRVFPGITDHIHFEVKVDGNHIDPTNILTRSD